MKGDRVFRFSIALALAIVTYMHPCYVRAQTNAPSLPARSNVFRILLLANKQTYRPGESILIRLSLTNASQDDVHIQVAPSFYLVGLLIKDASGNVQQSPGLTTLVRLNSRFADIPVGKTIDVGYDTHDDPTGAWVNLDFWGYSLPAGTYSIQAIPNILGVVMNKDNTARIWFKTAREPSSNTVTITILP